MIGEADRTTGTPWRKVLRMGALASAICLAACDDNAPAYNERAGAESDLAACLKGPFNDACPARKLVDRKRWAASAQSAAARCSGFMASSPPPKPIFSPAREFWPETTAGRYHEALLSQCGDLWIAVQSDTDQNHRAIAGTSARQFFEHCLGSMSRRHLTGFETSLYCLNIYTAPDSLVGGYPSEYWAYLAYRTSVGKSVEWFGTVAQAVCEQVGTREPCRDAAEASRPAIFSALAKRSERDVPAFR